MPQGMHRIDLEHDISTIWRFVSVVENWVPLVPGYISHEVINDRQFMWTFIGEVGLMKKTITLQVDITEWLKPNEVKFALTGISSNFTGNGYFNAQDLGEKRTNMTGFLDITAKGVKAPMINSILKTYLPQATTELVEAMAERMSQNR